ncbi:hypothetical protein PQR66_19220 [Paraburkholderia agricolaris]|uniref:Uncharacterized protein n=1 Tax=Paraburkholderia agricolaris TaxID=2152888 RepID=A0ABW8ZQH2_9BURK
MPGVIVEVSGGWPMPNMNVWLKNPLGQKYATDYPRLEYTCLGDPRNWLEHCIDIETGAMVAAKWITTRSVSGSTLPSTRTSPRGSRIRIVPGAGAEGVDAAGSATPPSLASFMVTGSKARPHASAPSRLSR